MLQRCTQICAAIFVILIFSSCEMPPTDSPLRFVAEAGYNLFVTIRPAQIWNSDLMQELMDEVSDRTIERINSDWKEAFGIGINENTFLFGAIDLPGDLQRGRIRDAIFIGGGPVIDENIRDVCTRFFKPSDYIERSHDGGTYYEIDPPHDNYTFAYAKTDNAAILGLEKSVTDSLEVLVGRKRSIFHDAEYSRYRSLINEDAGISALVWDVDDVLRMGVAFLRMQQGENIPKETADALNSLVAMGVSVDFGTDLALTFRSRFEDEKNAQIVRDFVQTALNNFKEGDGLRDLMILFGSAADKEEDLLAIIEKTEVFTDDSTLIIYQEIPGDSPILYNLRDAFFGAAENSETEPQNSDAQTPTDSGTMSSSTVYDLDRNNQTKTILHISALGQAVENYIIDNPGVGAPKVSNNDALVKLLLEQNNSFREEWAVDGWGNELIYETGKNGSSKSYRLISYGSDGRQGPQPADPEFITKNEEDIIYSNGNFIQRPRGRTIQ